MQRIINVEAISNLLIRPPKFTYCLSDLGPNVQIINKSLTYRYDFRVKNASQETLHCSLYYQGKLQNINTCLVYLHCNCGCRIQAKQLVQPSIKAGYAMLSFDFAGCGHSQGEFISLGYHEVFDLKVVIGFLQRITCDKLQLILWGRSMGAVTAIRYMAQDHSHQVKLAILDSPFLSLNTLICELVNQKVGMPKFLVEIFLKYVEPFIEQKAGFKISELNLDGSIQKISCPLIFIASKEDNLIPYQHIQQLYQRHKGKKTVYYLQEDHNQPRKSDIIDKVFKTIWKHQIQAQQALQQSNLNRPTQSINLVKRSLSKRKISLTVIEKNQSFKGKLKECTKEFTKQSESRPKFKTFLSFESQKSQKTIKDPRKIKALLKENRPCEYFLSQDQSPF